MEELATMQIGWTLERGVDVSFHLGLAGLEVSWHSATLVLLLIFTLVM